MSSTATPDDGLTDNANTVRKAWEVESGEKETQEWRGKREDVSDKYEALKGTAVADGIASLDFQSQEGRARES